MRLNNSSIAFLIAAVAAGLYGYYYHHSAAGTNAETCHFDSRDAKTADGAAFSCQIVPEGSSMKYTMVIQVFANSPQELRTGFDSMSTNIYGQGGIQKDMKVIGTKFDSWAYTIAAAINNPAAPAASQPPAIVAPPVKKQKIGHGR